MLLCLVLQSLAAPAPATRSILNGLRAAAQPRSPQALRRARRRGAVSFPLRHLPRSNLRASARSAPAAMQTTLQRHRAGGGMVAARRWARPGRVPLLPRASLADHSARVRGDLKRVFLYVSDFEHMTQWYPGARRRGNPTGSGYGAAAGAAPPRRPHADAPTDPEPGSRRVAAWERPAPAPLPELAVAPQRLDRCPPAARSHERRQARGQQRGPNQWWHAVLRREAVPAAQQAADDVGRVRMRPPSLGRGFEPPRARRRRCRGPSSAGPGAPPLTGPCRAAATTWWTTARPRSWWSRA
jgi:hypothetical protein